MALPGIRMEPGGFQGGRGPPCLGDATGPLAPCQATCETETKAYGLSFRITCYGLQQQHKLRLKLFRNGR
jgi:hypothetical protein